MLDPRTLAERRDEIAESIRKRGGAADLDGAIAAHELVTAAQTRLNDANRERNEHQKLGKRPLPPDEREAHGAEGRRLKEAVAGLERDLGDARAALDEALQGIPNFVHPAVPEGGEDDFKELRRVGDPPRFDFAPRDHLEIGAELDLLDFESGARVAGQKFFYLRNEAALLEMALQRFALDRLVAEGFIPVVTPDVARPEVVAALGFSPKGPETQIYSLANADLCLVGTAEITLGGLYADTILEEDDLPIRLAGVSHCFRTEAGSHGRESKGLYRVHQFSKVEMFALTRPEDSEAMHDELLGHEERIYADLEIPYRVIDVASGDLGAPAWRKFDIEAWMPGRGEGGEWGEVTSTSNCTDYQARRLRTRFRRRDGKKNEPVHMLNGTAIAVSRTLIALLENHQQVDGSVTIPAALRPYTGFDRIGPKNDRV